MSVVFLSMQADSELWRVRLFIG